MPNNIKQDLKILLYVIGIFILIGEVNIVWIILNYRNVG